jgi:Zn finger protein HypA/HybF involved in hydrogenase expression
MHDTHLLRNILKYFQEQEELTSRKIKKAYFSISEFGSLNKEHFLEHYKQLVYGTRFQGLEIAVKTIPFGPELEVTGLEFVGETEDRKK